MRMLLSLFLVLFLAWDIFWVIMGVKPLFPWQLQEKMAQTPAKLVLLDVRTPREFRWFHLPGAQNMPFENRLIRTQAIPKSKTVVVICLTGHRSAVMAYHLLKVGYPRVYNLTWGMAGWEIWKWGVAVWKGRRSEPELKQAYYHEKPGRPL